MADRRFKRFEYLPRVTDDAWLSQEAAGRALGCRWFPGRVNYLRFYTLQTGLSAAQLAFTADARWRSRSRSAGSSVVGGVPFRASNA